MATQIEAKEVTVARLFSPDFIFEVPIYQRPLSWEKDNYDELFEDIFDAMESDQPQYFLGSIVLQEYDGGKGKYYIVDGQQRLSALAILMAVVRDRTGLGILKRNLASYLFQQEDKYKRIPSEIRILPWDDLRGMFHKYIYEADGTETFMEDFHKNEIKYTDTQDPRYHLYEAISCFNQKLNEKLERSEDMEKFVTYLLNNVYLVYVKTSTFASAFRLFNVLNTRGMQLTTPDLLKSENIGAIQDTSARLRYASIWRDIESDLGREKLEDVIAFIRTIHIREKAKESIYDEYRKLIFGKGILKKGEEFIDYLNEMGDIYSERILQAEIPAEPEKKNRYKIILDLLHRFVPFSDWVPPLMFYYRKFGASARALDFLLRLEKKVIIEWVAGFTPTERITSLNRVIKLLERCDKAEEAVDRLLFREREEPTATSSSRTLDFANKNEIESTLMAKLDDSKFYSIGGGKLCKYILSRIDMELWDLENFPGYSGTITVEHVLPQAPPEGSQWLSAFGEEERIQWTHRLGNLILLSGRKNSRAQNYDFDRKKTVYFKKRSTPFRIAQSIESEDKWTLKELKARHEQLLNQARGIFLDY